MNISASGFNETLKLQIYFLVNFYRQFCLKIAKQSPTYSNRTPRSTSAAVAYILLSEILIVSAPLFSISANVNIYRLLQCESVMQNFFLRDHGCLKRHSNSAWCTTSPTINETLKPFIFRFFFVTLSGNRQSYTWNFSQQSLSLSLIAPSAAVAYILLSEILIVSAPLFSTSANVNMYRLLHCESVMQFFAGSWLP